MSAIDATTAVANAVDDELIVLVDEDGTPTGTAAKRASHHADTPLHLAFSCYVFDEEGRFLATRRARSKAVWPGVWSNTVCGHPGPGESVPEAIRRRLDYELGMAAGRIELAVADHLYRAPAFRGVVEHEFCPVYVARAVGQPRPNPVEVEDCAWMGWEAFVRGALEDCADEWSWWCKNQLRELRGNALVERYMLPASTAG
ncbi:MAG: isopentenyl-diphosphate Delta-isomerase [Solirubrobacteraceae bacterium]